MFTRIRYDVRFAPTLQYPEGRVFSREHDLKPGFGAIVGANEQGKSLILEFMRFLVFGAKALRGPTGDYGTLAVEGDLKLGDDHFKIERSISTAKLWLNGELVARGTTPVNNRLRERLGFGLNVFDVANSINQGEVEALSDMKPTERQKLIGGVVGLDKIDGLAVWANEQALGFEREATAIERGLVAPVRPDEPECWPNRGMIRDWLKLAEEHQLELAKIDGQLAAPGIAKPTEPGARPTERTEVELSDCIRDNVRHRELTTELDRLPVIDVPEAQEAIEAYEAWVEAQTFLKQNPPAPLTVMEAMAVIDAWELIDEWGNYDLVQKERTRLQEQIDHADDVDCPSCGHTFPLDADHVAKLKEELANWPELEEPTRPKPETPQVLRAQANTRVDMAEEIDAIEAKRAAALAIPEPHRPTYSRLDLERYDPTRASMIEAELATLDTLAGAEQMLDDLRRWTMLQTNYEAQLAQYEDDQERRRELKAKRAELEYAPERVADLRPVVARFDPYEQALARYEHDQTIYTQRLSEVQGLRTKAEQWRAAKDALATLRGLIKQHLYPSLAKAASVLIAGMTGGARRKIEIDEDFNVMVDGQRLDTLSGSGKAVANLAIRLGLGQVLTHKVFPVIFADEIDASMDEDRAASTQDILLQCARRVSQLLLVSHKRPEADWFIDLGGMSERP